MMAEEQRNDRNSALNATAIQEIIDCSLAIDEPTQLARLERLYALVKWWCDPTVVGGENIPKQGPVLYVGNHSVMAADAPAVLPVLTRLSGRFVRGMSDELMYRNPRVRKIIASAGAVVGHQDVGAALFAAGKDILLFPGGAHEAFKHLDERYEIKWKERTGFVRMAAKYGVPIVPVGIVGPDEWFGRYLERDQIANSKFAGLLKRVGASAEFLQSDQLPPIPKGLFGTLLPKPLPLYISIGEPIATAAYRGKELSAAQQRELRDQARQRLRQCIDQMLLLQAQHRESSGLLRRLLSL